MDKFLKRSEVANLLRVSERTVMRYHQRGLKRHIIDGSTRYRLNDVLEYAENNKKGSWKK